ncbi:sn-glycerol-3-phosphate import ATP-binding protein UgpC [Frigidibacter albus]
MASISIENLTKIYPGGTRAVDGVNLDIADGEMLVLVGPSGCGKSTLLRMVAGLEEISEGTLRIGGQVVNDLDPADRDVAMVFQNYALYPHMTVRDNLTFGLENRRMPKPEITRRVTDVADLLQIAPLLDRKPRALSGGQRQRVAMGRAIIREPALFLFDEPLSNLDAKLRGQMRFEIKQLQTRLRTTSIYVTHDQIEALTLADRLVVLNGGRIEQIGTPAEVYHTPATTFVAEFIGTPAMNFLPANGLRAALAGSANLPPLAGLIGIRAEHIGLARKTDACLPLQGVVVMSEHIGAEYLVHFDLPEMRQDRPTIVQVKADHQPTPNQPMTLFLDPRKLHGFDSKSGRRLAGS